MNVGDTVAFKQQYGMPVLRIVGDAHRYVYRRRRVTGTITQVVHVAHMAEPVLMIEVDGAPAYSSLVGMPLSKVRSR
jgi:hypothetical protein